jgi:hypothetical protein
MHINFNNPQKQVFPPSSSTSFTLPFTNFLSTSTNLFTNTSYKLKPLDLAYGLSAYPSPEPVLSFASEARCHWPPRHRVLKGILRNLGLCLYVLVRLPSFHLPSSALVSIPWKHLLITSGCSHLASPTQFGFFAYTFFSRNFYLPQFCDRSQRCLSAVTPIYHFCISRAPRLVRSPLLSSRSAW